jgi:pre-mRNA-splicing factor SYF2
MVRCIPFPLYKPPQKRRAEELSKIGLSADEAYRLLPAEKAEQLYEKNTKKRAPEGAAVFNQQAIYRAYEKRTENIPYSKEDYEKMKKENPEFYRTADSLLHGQAAAVPAENVDKMVAELEAVAQKRGQFSRRRAYREDRDVDACNDRNAKYNAKLERAFGKSAADIKANLERGTALPDK